MLGFRLPGSVPELRVPQPLFDVPEAVRLERSDGLGEEVNGTALAGLSSVLELRLASDQGDSAPDARLATNVGLIR